MWPAAAPLVMCMHGYTGGVAAIRYYSYPAIMLFRFYKFCNVICVCISEGLETWK